MKIFKSYFISLLILCIGFLQLLIATEKTDNSVITSPKDFFGFTPGDDRKLISYEDLVEYLFLLEKESSMIKMHHAGNSPMGKPMYITFISSPKNISNIESLKDINRELAINPSIKPEKREQFIEDGKVFIMATMSMHSSETGPSQAVPVIAYELISYRYDEVRQYLDNIVLMIIPSHNPDGMNMIVEHYKKYLGTPYEGSTLPGVYHKYIGHNNNRDFLSLTQEDTRVIANIYNTEWYPQVLVEKHEMGVSGVRYFVPPNHDPIAENIDEGVWNWTWVFGSNMSKHMTSKGLTGITQHYLFDDYWPGSTQTSSWKNVISILTEAASVRLATPVYVEKSEIRVWGKGLAEYKKSINMPIPWDGGWWRLSDIVRYEVESIFAMIKTGSLFKKEILTFRNDLCIKEVNKGYNESPFFYIIPQKQHDNSELIAMLQLLIKHGVSIHKLNEDAVVKGRKYYAGDYVITLSQPYRPFIKEVMEKQAFPVRRYTPGGEMIRPYDITSWSLPLHRGIESHEVTIKHEWLYNIIEIIQPDELKNKDHEHFESGLLIFSANNNKSYKFAFNALSQKVNINRSLAEFEVNGNVIPKGSFLVEINRRNSTAISSIISGLNHPPIHSTATIDVAMETVKLPRIALTETFMHDMDAGWTRFLFDNYNIPYTIIRPGDFKTVNLSKDYDIIIFPDNSKDVLMTGRRKRGDRYFVPFFHPDYTKGIEKAGWQEVIEFIEQGGIVLSWAQSIELFTDLMETKSGESFNFPVSNVSSNLKSQGFYCPGSLLSLDLRQGHKLTYGMPERIGVFHRDNIILSTSVPTFDMDRRIIGSFPESSILLSGYIQKEELLEIRPAVVWLSKGKGQVVLLSFAPNFRGSTPNAYKLIFNTLLLQ